MPFVRCAPYVRRIICALRWYLVLRFCKKRLICEKSSNSLLHLWQDIYQYENQLSVAFRIFVFLISCNNSGLTLVLVLITLVAPTLIKMMMKRTCKVVLNHLHCTLTSESRDNGLMYTEKSMASFGGALKEIHHQS